MRALRRLILLALAAGMSITAPATAQFGEAAGFSEMMSPYFLRRDLNTFVNGLEMDDVQASILESLFWDYEDEHQAGRERMIERLTQMRDTLQQVGDRDEVLHLVFKPFEDRSAEWNEMRETFLDNVQAILSEEQREIWPAFRRELRRVKELPKGRFSGEAIDLFSVLTELDIHPEVLKAVSDLTLDYEVAVDEALARRESLFQDSRLPMLNSLRDEDPNTALDIHRRQIDARIAVRNANDAHRDRIAQGLPEELGTEFRQRALERGYSRVYRPTSAERLFDEALELEDLSEETRAAVQSLHDAFATEIGALNNAICEMIRTYEPDEAMFRARNFASRTTGETPTRPIDPTLVEFNNREQLGRRYVELLRGLLTPDQFGSLKGASRFLRRKAREGMDGLKGDSGGQGGADRKNRIRRDRQVKSLGGGSGE